MRSYRAGDTVEELCRACKIDRLHTVIATDAAGRPVRVQCDYCGSQHNSRGERAAEVRRPAAPAESRWQSTLPRLGRAASNTPAFLTASDLERKPAGPAAPETGERLARTGPSADEPSMTTQDLPQYFRAGAPTEGEEPMADMAGLEELLRRIIREESGLTPAAPAEKWRGGTLVLKPANPSLQEKSWPIDTIFHKITMIRNRLRTLEQQLNSMDVPEDVKAKLQAYITGCYGSLTSFNVLFAYDEDRFQGSGGEA